MIVIYIIIILISDIISEECSREKPIYKNGDCKNIFCEEMNILMEIVLLIILLSKFNG